MKLRNLWRYLKINHKKIILFAVPTAFLLVSIFVGANYLQTKKQTPTKSSAGGTVALSFAPSGQSVARNTNFSTKVRIEPVGKKITAIELHLTFDSSKINLISLTPFGPFSNVLIQPSISNAAGTAVIVLGVPVPPATPVSVDSDVVTVNAKTLGVSGLTEIKVGSSSLVAAVGSDTNVAGNFGSTAIKVLSPTVTLTPTPTSTSVKTPTPTPTSTSVSTVTPTATATSTPVPTGTPNSCGGTCGSNMNCQSAYYCFQGFCRNPSCPYDTTCGCASPSPTPTQIPTPTPTTAARLVCQPAPATPRAGDINGDGCVNILDIGQVINHYTSAPNDSNYDAKCDINIPKDGLCNIIDIQIIINHWYNPGQ